MRAAKLRPTTPPPPPLADAAISVSVLEVLGNDDLLRQILLRLDLPPSLVAAALVSRRWLAAASDPAFLREFRARSPPRLLGFLAAFARGSVRFVPVPHPSELDGAARRVAGAFSGGGSSDLAVVVDCRNGRVLRTRGGRDGTTYSVASPLRPPPAAPSVAHRPTRFHPAAGPGPPGVIKYDVLCGHLEVLPDPRAGAGDIRDALSRFGRTALFRPRYNFTEPILPQEARFLQQWVYVWQGEAWIAHVSPPLQIPIPVPVLINEAPYSLLVGNRICTMMVLGCIVVLDLATETFSIIEFPSGVSCEVRILNHRLARAGDTGVYLIHVNGVELHIWLRRMDGEGGIWELVNKVSLPVVFGDHVPKQFWDSVRALNDDVDRSVDDLEGDHYVEIHAVGDNAEFVFLTVGEQGSVFLLDVKRRAIEKVLQTSLENDGHLYGIFPFMMPWPPVFPEAKQKRAISISDHTSQVITA